jgi:hypothetical protein
MLPAFVGSYAVTVQSDLSDEGEPQSLTVGFKLLTGEPYERLQLKGDRAYSPNVAHTSICAVTALLK